MALLFGYKALSEELIDDVGEVGHDEDEDHGHPQIGCLDPCLGQKVCSVSTVRIQISL